MEEQPHAVRQHVRGAVLGVPGPVGGVIWTFRSGAQWREVPEEFGNWSTVYDQSRKWRDTGVFQALMEAVIAEAARRDQVDLSLVSVDSTTARAHHDAAGMRVDAKTLSALEKALVEERGPRQGTKGSRSRRTWRCGRSRPPGRAPTPVPTTPGTAESSRPGPLTRRADQQGPRGSRPPLPPTGLHPHPGTGRRQPPVRPGPGQGPGPRPGRPPPHPPRRGGWRQGVLLPRQPRPPARTRHQGRHPGEEGPGGQPEERGRRGGRPVTHDEDLYKDRNTVERLINKLKAWRGIAARHDKTPDTYLAAVHLRGTVIWLHSLQATP